MSCSHDGEFNFSFYIDFVGKEFYLGISCLMRLKSHYSIYLRMEEYTQDFQDTQVHSSHQVSLSLSWRHLSSTEVQTNEMSVSV